MGIDDLLAGSSKNKLKNIKTETQVGSMPEPTEESKEYFTIYGKVSIREKIDNIVWIKKYIIEHKDFSRAEIIEQALELLSDKMNYEKFYKQHKEKIDNAKPKRGKKVK